MKTLLLIASEYPPVRSSAAVQLSDLSKEMVSLGYSVMVITPVPKQNKGIEFSVIDGVKVLKVKSINTKSSSYVLRAFAEFLSPYFMLVRLATVLRNQIPYDECFAIIWYSPSIFLVPLVKYFKKRTMSPSYLILRDIFPKWAVDLGLIKNRLIYLIFKFFENRQYRYADIIGVQSKGNLDYFKDENPVVNVKLDVLHNWLSKSTLNQRDQCKTNLSLFTNKKIFVYAGNMGVAQGLVLVIRSIKKLSYRNDVGFLFVGRGSEVKRLQDLVADLNIKNVIFADEIPSAQISSLYKRCHFGIVCLDKRHKTHNIPGKFLSYLEAGLPVLALVNPGNDLIDIIESNNVGVVSTAYSENDLEAKINFLLDKAPYKKYSSSCNDLYKRSYLTSLAVKRILLALGTCKQKKALKGLQ